MSRKIISVLSFLLGFYTTIIAQNIIEGEILVQLRSNVSVEEVVGQVNKTKSGQSLEIMRTLSEALNIHLLTFDKNKVSYETIESNLTQQKYTLATQPNYQINSRNTTPDDPLYERQWGLEKIKAPELWDITTGGVTVNGDTIVIAILDSGYELSHPDFQGNLWVNRAEIAGDGIDNDNNGYVDDTQGWNFVQQSNVQEQNVHGQSVAGIIGAKGDNGEGVSGVNWNVKMLMLSTINVDEIVEAYQYIINLRRLYNETNGAEGAFIVATNASFGIDNVFCSEQPIWGQMYDRMGEVGILTAAATANQAWNIEERGDMPTTCTSDYLLTVLNTTENDTKYQGSAYGATSIDMGAPGHNSYTTKLRGEYGSFSGNSAAAPHLTGAIGLLYSIPCKELSTSAMVDPEGTALLVRNVLLDGVDQVSGLEDYTVTGGRLNVFKAMETIQKICGGTTGPLSVLEISPNPSNTIVRLEYETPDFDPYQISIFNTIGQLIQQETVIPSRFDTKKYSFSVSGWSPGIYILTLSNEEEAVSEIIVVY